MSGGLWASERPADIHHGSPCMPDKRGSILDIRPYGFYAVWNRWTFEHLAGNSARSFLAWLVPQGRQVLPSLYASVFLIHLKKNDCDSAFVSDRHGTITNDQGEGGMLIMSPWTPDMIPGTPSVTRYVGFTFLVREAQQQSRVLREFLAWNDRQRW